MKAYDTYAVIKISRQSKQSIDSPTIYSPAPGVTVTGALATDLPTKVTV
jgi:hypothetical protein